MNNKLDQLIKDPEVGGTEIMLRLDVNYYLSKFSPDWVVGFIEALILSYMFILIFL